MVFNDLRVLIWFGETAVRYAEVVNQDGSFLNWVTRLTESGAALNGMNIIKAATC
jgi:hypothetical protein